jgi:hypothetical protein
MLRSSSDTAAVRWVFYGLAAFCVSLFGYGFFHVVRVAAESTDGGVRVVLGLSALGAAGQFAAVAIGAARSPHYGGHFLVSMASLFGAFVTFIGLLIVAF